MTPTPTDISAVRDQGVLRIDWGDETVDLSFVYLRSQCECAHCVNEWTGERLLDPDTIPADITLEKMELVGSYALRIHWSDNHNTGLYTWQHLQELSQKS